MTANDNPGRIYTACVLVIGNEILSGRTQDANLSWLATQLNASGIRLREARVVADVEDDIVSAVNEVRKKYDYIFTTGGIGPTHDDITADCIAKAFGVTLYEHPEIIARLTKRFTNPADLNPARRRMARVPEGGTLIDNAASLVPGFQIGNVYVLAGVPSIMRSMFEWLRPSLKGGAPMLSRSVSADLPEGKIAAGLSALQNRYADLEIGSYPYFRDKGPGTAIVTRGTEKARIDAAVAELKVLMRELGAEPVEEAVGKA
jgi:molybdenum cofactor synthesis domain-containing protein